MYNFNENIYKMEFIYILKMIKMYESCLKYLKMYEKWGGLFKYKKN